MIKININSEIQKAIWNTTPNYNKNNSNYQIIKMFYVKNYTYEELIIIKQILIKLPQIKINHSNLRAEDKYKTFIFRETP